MRGHAILTAAAERRAIQSRRWRCWPRRPAPASTPATRRRCWPSPSEPRAQLPARRRRSRTRFLAAIAHRDGPRSSAATRRPARRRLREAVAPGRAHRPSCATTRAAPLADARRRSSCARPAPAARCSSDALDGARDRSAVGALPLVLDLLARDQATSDRWAVAEATYRRRSHWPGDRPADRAGLRARRPGLAAGARGHASRSAGPTPREALALSAQLGTRLYEVWVTARSASSSSGSAKPARAAEQFERQQRTAARSSASPTSTVARRRSWSRPTCGWAAPRRPQTLTAALPRGRAEAKGQPWSLAGAALRGLVADEAGFDAARSSRRWSCTRRRRTRSSRRARSWPTASACAAPATASGPRAAARRAGDLRAPGRSALGRAGPDRAGRERRDAAPPRPDHDRRADAPGAPDRAAARLRARPRARPRRPCSSAPRRSSTTCATST